MKLFEIIKKNFKLLVRSKTSALVVILGPLLLVFILGLAFDTSKAYSLEIGLFSEAYSNSSEDLISTLSSSNIRTFKYFSENNCSDGVKKGEVDACVIIPSDFDFDRANNLTFYVDFSRTNIVWAIMESFSEKIDEKSKDVSLNLTSILLNKISSTKSKLANQKIVVTEIQEELSLQNKEIDKQQTSLSGISLDIKKEDFGVSSPLSSLNSIKATLQEQIDYIILKTNNSYEDLEDLISSCSSCDNTTITELTEIKDLVSTALSKTNNMNSSIGQLNGVSEELAEVNNALDSALSKINSAKTSIFTSKTKLNIISENLDSAYLKVSGTKTLIDLIIKDIDSIQVSDAATIVNPISTNIKPVTTESTTLNYLFPNLIVIVIMFISILLSSTIIMIEKKSSAYFRNFVTPTKDIVFLIANFLTSFILLIVQLLIILVITAYFFKTQVLSSFLPTLIILILTSSFFILVGMAIGYLFNSEETSILASISLTALFLVLSNTFISIQGMPKLAASIAQKNPFVIAEGLLRQSILFQSSFSELFHSITILFYYVIIIFIVVLLIQKFMHKNFFFKNTKKMYKLNNIHKNNTHKKNSGRK